MKRGFAHQILRVIARDKHLGQRNKIRSSIAALNPNVIGLVSIALQVANDWVQLPQSDPKRVCHSAASWVHLFGDDISEMAARERACANM